MISRDITKVLGITPDESLKNLLTRLDAKLKEVNSLVSDINQKVGTEGTIYVNIEIFRDGDQKKG